MKKLNFNESLNNIDIRLVEEFTLKCEKIEKNARIKKRLLRITALAACLCFIMTIALTAPFGGSITNIKVKNVQSTLFAPTYYGSAQSAASGTEGTSSLGCGLSVTAQVTEILPDTYTFFDDWAQKEFRIVKMKLVTLLCGKEMADEFYYIIPADYMTDFSVFDKVVSADMGQFGYEYSVVYNKTRDKAERLDLVLCGYSATSYHFMGEKFMAFDSDGNFDERLWNSTEAWKSATEGAARGRNLANTEKITREIYSVGKNDYIHSVAGVTSEAADILSYITSLENGVYVQQISQKLHLSPEIQFNAARYINGFPTNECFRIEEDRYTATKARFTESDLQSLPNLYGAITAVAEAYGKGKINPPHIDTKKHSMLKDHGIFAWYAKTQNGVIGVVRVSWDYYGNKDDAYFIIEYGSDTCKAIDRDALLERIGNYEKTYVYQGKYDENGKLAEEYGV